MSSMSTLGVGLAVVFGCFVVLLLGELYYLFCWRRTGMADGRVNSLGHDPLTTDIEVLTHNLPVDTMYLHSCGVYDRNVVYPDVVEKLFSVATDLTGDGVNLHTLLGPPRILFTIKEETKEDLECADSEVKKPRSRRRSRSLDSMNEFEFDCRSTGTPYHTPQETPSTSPSFITPNTTPSSSPPPVSRLSHSRSPGVRAKPFLEYPLASLSYSPKGSPHLLVPSRCIRTPT